MLALQVVALSYKNDWGGGMTKDTSGNLTVGGNLTTNGNLTVRINRLFANVNGVGVGTTGIFADFQVQRSTNARLEIDSSSTGISYQVVDNARTGYLQNVTIASQHLWFNGLTEAMRLNSNGLGIGASPTQKLHVKGIVNFEQISGGTNGWQLYTYTDGSYRMNYNGAGSDELIIDTSGNVGIKVEPSAWNSSAKAFEIGTAGNSVFSSGATFVEMTNNAYLDSVSNWVRVDTGNAAARFRTSGSGFLWAQAAAGANPITWTTTMQLDSNGNLILQSSATPATLTTNGQLTVNATSNTNLRFSYRGSDGVTRVANITLA